MSTAETERVAQVFKDEECRSDLQHRLETAEKTLSESQAALALVRSQEAAQVNNVLALATSIEGAQKELADTVQSYLQQSLFDATAEHVHAVSCTITSTVLPYAPFKDGKITAPLASELTCRDLLQLLDLKSAGLRHRLLHCLRRATGQPVADLLGTDFAQAVESLRRDLSATGELDRHLIELLYKAQVDKLTCGDITLDTLAEAGVSPAARKQVLAALHTVDLGVKVAQSHDFSVSEAWDREDVLEQVLRENTSLATRLKLAEDRATEAPHEYLCPITHDVMHDPVMTEDGQTYEREAITTWVGLHHTCPMTRKPIAKQLFPNRVLKALIQRWLEQQKV
jgi:hypothetical protein